MNTPAANAVTVNNNGCTAKAGGGTDTTGPILYAGRVYGTGSDSCSAPSYATKGVFDHIELVVQYRKGTGDWQRGVIAYPPAKTPWLIAMTCKLGTFKYRVTTKVFARAMFFNEFNQYTWKSYLAATAHTPASTITC